MYSTSLLAGTAASADQDVRSPLDVADSIDSGLASTRGRRGATVAIAAAALLLVGLVGSAVLLLVPSRAPFPAQSAAAFLRSTGPSPSVVTSLPQGAIRGLSADGCTTYYSIPFAQPPVGELRWLPPQLPPPSWSGERDGTQPPPHCAQPGGDGVFGQEDCLYLNVQSNPAWAGQGPLPVLLFIHGGSSLSGYSADYDHCDLVRLQPVVAITVNYRLNVFGYLALEELSQRQANYTRSKQPTSGNYGLRDNIAALQWVRDNIAHFQGDPSAVTIYGQSTGGTNVMAVYVSPLAAGLFRSALSLSGSPVLRGSLQDAERQNAEFVANSNCSRPSSNDTLACLLALTPAEAWAAAPRSWLGSLDFGLPSLLTPDAMVIAVDGEVVTHELNTALRMGAGGSRNATLVYSHMGQEVDLGPISNVTGYTQAQWEAWLDDSLPPLGWNKTVATALKAAYPISDYDGEAQLAYDTLVTDITRCGGVHNLRSLASRTSPPPPPIYHVLDEFAPVVPPYSPPSWPVHYACHIWDLNLLLRSWPQGYQTNSTHWGGLAGDERRSETLRRLYVDELVRGGGDRTNGSLWTEFNYGWQGGRPGTMYTARLGREGELNVVADLRWDKCVLLDGLGFASAGWAN